MLKQLKALTKDTFTYGMANVLGQIIGFVLLPVYTAYLSPKDYGIIAMLAMVSLFFIPIAAVGITNAIFRRFNLHLETEKQILALSTGSVFVFISSAIWLILGLSLASQLTTFLVDDQQYEYLVYISLATSFFMSIGDIFTVVLRAQRKVTTLAVIRVSEILITVCVSIYLVVVLELVIEGVLWGGLIGALLSTLCLFAFSKNLLKWDFDRVELKALISYGAPFLPHTLIGIANIFVGQYFIKSFVGLEEMGLFSIARKFALPLSFVIGAIQSAWVPIKFQIHREEGEGRKAIFRNLISIYFILIMFLFAGVVTLGPEILRWMTNPDYYEASKLLPFVLLIFVARGTYFMMATGFEFTNNTKPMPLVSGTGFLALIFITFLSKDYIGVYGILSGMIISWWVMALIIRRLAINRFYIPTNFIMVIGVLLNTIILAVLIYYFQRFSFSTRIVLESITFLTYLIVIIIVLLKSSGTIGYGPEFDPNSAHKLKKQRF